MTYNLRKFSLKDKTIKNSYSFLCKIYQIVITFIENSFLKKIKKRSLKLGLSKYFSNCQDFSIVKNKIPIQVNKYLSIRKLDQKDLNILIRNIFTKDFRNYITNRTGFEYSIDFFIAYDRENIEIQDRDVSTLEQWYSYKWHYDKPNSSNMLKIIIPLNIGLNDGPLELIDKNESKKINDLKKINNESSFISKFVGKGDFFYLFNPRLCIHRDGIPPKFKTSTQIMFQLNPWKNWTINPRIFKSKVYLNDALEIWTSEPKFTQLMYLIEKRIKMN